LRPEPYFIIRVRATPAMTSRPYAVWRDMLSFRFEILDTDSPEVVRQKMESGVEDMIGPDDKLAHLMAHLAGFEFEDSSHLAGDAQALANEARTAAFTFIRRLCEVDPTVMQLDDLHHADEATIDLLAEMAMVHPDLRLLIVGTARPVLFERRPAWGSGLAYHRRIDLRRLDRRDSRDLVAEVLKRLDDLPRDLRDLIVDRAEGNPYYVEELVKMLVEDRVIQKISKTRWIVEGSRLQHLRVPQTLIGLLQTRLDTLLYPERLTLQRAAVIGRVFHDGAIRALDAADDTHVEDLDGTLADLVRREFIFPRESSAFAGNREFIFGQAMLRDVILETLLDRQIARYSLAMAAWLGLQGGDRAGEYDALIANYLEKAGEPQEAAEYMLRAGTGASARGALNEAIALYERGLNLLGVSDNSKLALDLRLNLAATYGWLGDYLSALEHLEPAVASARSLAERQAEASALAQIGRIKGYWQGHHALGLKLLEDALSIANEVNDQPSRAFVLRQLGNLAIAQGDFEEASRFLNKSLAIARGSSDHAAVANALNSFGEMARHQGQWAQARAFYDKGLEVLEEEKNPNIRSLILVNIATLLVEQGHPDKGLVTAEEALSLACDIGTKYIISSAHAVLSRAAMVQGDTLKARSHLKKAAARFYEIGNWPEFLSIVPEFAILMAREGKDSLAIEWLGMALARPELSFVTKRRSHEILQNLRERVTHDIITHALEKGAKREMSDFLLEL